MTLALGDTSHTIQIEEDLYRCVSTFDIMSISREPVVRLSIITILQVIREIDARLAGRSELVKRVRNSISTSGTLSALFMFHSPPADVTSQRLE